MNSPVVSLPSPALPGTEAAPAGGFWPVSAWASFAAGFLTAFTFSAIGEMPVGELVLLAAVLGAVLSAILNGAAPSPLFRVRFFWLALAAQTVALVAYVGSDLYRHSTPHDMLRGWGRMILLAADLAGIAYLFGCAARNMVVFIVGQALGLVAAALILGPMFGDMWKFGIGAPLTYFVFLVAPRLGPTMAMFGAFGMGAAHFALDYRSLGGLCMLAGTLTLVQIVRPAFRAWLVPVALAGAVAVIASVYGHSPAGLRATRSGIERSAMVQAALEAVRQSPLIGHGSWFSNSDVYDNFILIRHAAARAARVGGFVGPNHEPGAIALHSQLLVALAEGGIFGGAFFLVFGAGLVWALHDTVLRQPWHRFTPLCTLVLLGAFWNLLFSPFSGAHRVSIALACGLILLLQTRAAGPRAAEAPVDPGDDFAPLAPAAAIPDPRTR